MDINVSFTYLFSSILPFLIHVTCSYRKTDWLTYLPTLPMIELCSQLSPQKTIWSVFTSFVDIILVLKLCMSRLLKLKFRTDRPTLLLIEFVLHQKKIHMGQDKNPNVLIHQPILSNFWLYSYKLTNFVKLSKIYRALLILSL